jgi:hypothetical protein
MVRQNYADFRPTFAAEKLASSISKTPAPSVRLSRSTCQTGSDRQNTEDGKILSMVEPDPGKSRPHVSGVPCPRADEIPKITLVFAPTARGLIYTSNVVESLQRDEASARS